MQNDKNVLFRCPEDIREPLFKYAETNDITVSQILRRLVREFLDQIEQGGE